MDPATAGKLSGAHGGYLVDIKNYTDRWLCLAKLINPPMGDDKTCYSYPADWMILPLAEPTPPSSESKPPNKMQQAPLLEPFGPLPSHGLLKSDG